MRILVVSNLYPSRRYPAFGTFIAARVAALRRAGADVEVVAITEGNVHSDRARKYARLGGRAVAAGVRGRLQRSSRPDIVEAHIAFPTGLFAWPAARVTGAPLVLFAHGADVMSVPWKHALSRGLATRLFRSSDAIIANSTYLARQIEQRFRPDLARVHVISPGIPFDVFRTDTPIDDRRGIVFAGRLIPEKGVSVLLEALSRTEAVRAPHLALTVIGDGPLRADLQGRAAALNVEARFCGALPHSKVAEAMQQAAIVVVPSVYEEPLGLVAIEAMAAGAMVVASASGGLTETVTEGVNGFLAEPGDAASLAAAITRASLVIENPEEAVRMRSAAAATALTHDVDRAARQSLDLYRGLIS